MGVSKKERLDFHSWLSAGLLLGCRMPERFGECAHGVRLDDFQLPVGIEVSRPAVAQLANCANATNEMRKPGRQAHRPPSPDNPRVKNLYQQV